MKTVVSLFDESGNMLRPWAEHGYQCHMFDILNKDRSEGNMHWHKADLTDPQVHKFIIDLNPVLITSFPPCTDLAVSGAKHFETKRQRNPNFQHEAVTLAQIANGLGYLTGCPWMVENPVSVLATMWRKPNHIFHPYEFAGYLPEDDVHPRFPNIIPGQDRYTKRTCIWSGNGFIFPRTRSRTPIGDSNPGWTKLGGKSARTKQIRSETPRGFAQAVFEANSDVKTVRIDTEATPSP